MSANHGDTVVFEESTTNNQPSAESNLFSIKKYAFITDSNSSSGSFSSNQMQFDLSNFASQSQWINLPEAMLEFPVKVTIKNASSTAAVTAVATAGAAILKNGFHQFIDGCQLVIGSQTVQNQVPYENIAATWKILSNWSQDELVKNGPSCGFALDDCTGASEITLNNATAKGLNNVLYSDVANANVGLDVVGNQDKLINEGVSKRASFNNSNATVGTASLQQSVLDITAMQAAGRSHYASQAGGVSGSPTETWWSACYLATVRLRDLVDLSEFPLVKNVKGYLYLSLNSGKVTVPANAASGTMTMQTVGNTMPVLLNNSGYTPAAGGEAITITASVDGTTAGLVPPCKPLISAARLVCPYYIANPQTDAALSKSNYFFTMQDKLYFTFDCESNSTINQNITSGVTNPKRIVMLPLLKAMGGATNVINPALSAFDTSPATSSPFATMDQLQVYVGNVPIYQNPISMDYEAFKFEMAQTGLYGDMNDSSTSGLLSEQLWTQNHRWYTTDIGRRTGSDDGSSKSVQISYRNPNKLGQRVHGHLYHEKRYVIDTATCTIVPL